MDRGNHLGSIPHCCGDALDRAGADIADGEDSSAAGFHRQPVVADIIAGKDEAAPVITPMFDEWRRTRPGAVTQSDVWWEMVLGDEPYSPGGPEWLVSWPPIWSADGSTLACRLTSRATPRESVSRNGQRGEEFDRVGSPALSRDGGGALFRMRFPEAGGAGE